MWTAETHMEAWVQLLLHIGGDVFGGEEEVQLVVGGEGHGGDCGSGGLE